MRLNKLGFINNLLTKLLEIQTFQSVSICDIQLSTNFHFPSILDKLLLSMQVVKMWPLLNSKEQNS